MRDFKVRLTHRPGELARVTNALSLHGVNIKGVAALSIGNDGVLRILPDDVEVARAALRGASIEFEESELVIMLLENRAGELTGVAGRLAEAGVNLEALYMVGVADGLIEVAIAVDNVKKAKKALEEIGAVE